MSNQIIGKNIRTYREKMGLRQEDVANYLGLQREVVSYYENGTREVPMNNLKKLSELYGIEIYYLMEENAALNAVNSVVAFRTEGLTSDDLNVMSDFKKIVMNYLKLSELKEKNER